jgi:hypothetical protein
LRGHWGEEPPPLAELCVVHDAALAEILRGRLAAEGIEALLFDAGFAGLLGGGAPGIRVMVPAALQTRAERVLQLPENQAE